MSMLGVVKVVIRTKFSSRIIVRNVDGLLFSVLTACLDMIIRAEIQIVRVTRGCLRLSKVVSLV